MTNGEKKERGEEKKKREEEEKSLAPSRSKHRIKPNPRYFTTLGKNRSSNLFKLEKFLDLGKISDFDQF